MLVLVCGCAVGPNFHRPDAPPVTQYSNGKQATETVSVAGNAQRFEMGKMVAADWWHLFQSSALDAVIAEAIANNPGLDAAEASLKSSQDNLRSGYGIFYPSVDADAGATRERYTPPISGKSHPEPYSICSHYRPVSAMPWISSAVSGVSLKVCTRRWMWPTPTSRRLILR